METIYDLDTADLKSILIQIGESFEEFKTIQQESENCFGFLFSKYERKIEKIKSCIELEITERHQIDEIISFFTQPSQNENPLIGTDEDFEIYLKQSIVREEAPSRNLGQTKKRLSQ